VVAAGDRATSRGGSGSVAALGLLAASYAAVRSGRSERLDRRAAKALAYPLGHRVDVVVAAGTDLGSVYGIAGLATVLAVTGRRRAALDVAAVGAIAWTAAQASKPLVGRERPYVVEGADRLVAVPAGSSWPSGHVAVASGMAAILGDHLRRPARRVARAAAVGVAVSRCYVGVHHLTDVLAGWGVGVLSAASWRGLRRLAVRALPVGDRALTVDVRAPRRARGRRHERRSSRRPRAAASGRRSSASSR
jgi:membrane-associated phospholipid phosphatase